jgi:heptosyltransferase II
MRMGLLLPNWVGDAVMATPALLAIRQRFPEATICGLMRPVIADTLAGCDFFDGIIYYDRRARQTQLGTRVALRRLRQFRPETMVLLTNSSLRAALLGYLSGATRRVGYGGWNRWRLLTERLELPRPNGADRPFSVGLAEAVIGEPVGHPMQLATRPRDEQAADEVWAESGWDDSLPVVALNTGGAYGPAKDWPSEYFAGLARRIVRELSAAVLIVCGPAERQVAARIEKQAADPRVRSLAPRGLSIGLTKACLRRSRMLITTDSGPRHIAAAFGIPVISLFGPTDPHWSENYHARETKMYLKLSCQPCDRRVCPLVHHRCMRELTVDSVFAAVAAQWAAGTKEAA